MSAKLENLRKILKQGGFHGFIVRHADEFGEETIAPSAERLKWLTGFTGSFGIAFIFMDKAYLLTDGRYLIQAAEEVDATDFTVVDYLSSPPSQVILDNLKTADKMGYDPKLHPIAGIAELRRICLAAGASAVAIKNNPIDEIWQDRPATPSSIVSTLDESFAGQGAKGKISTLAHLLQKQGQDAVIITSPSSICWLLNVRGADVAYTPLVHSFAIVHATDSVDWFIDSERVPALVRQALGDKVRLLPPAIFGAEIERLAKKQKVVRLDPRLCPARVENIFGSFGGKMILKPDPCTSLKAVKNETEITHLLSAHIKDGIALCRHAIWLEESLAAGKVITEYDSAKKLDEIKQSDSLYRGESFATISATGANAAVTHYTPTKEKSAPISNQEVYLLDSGSQYLEGTTDVTRTIAFAPQSPEVKARFTEILKGHIALSSVIFPKGTFGFQLDSLARQFLWASGCDYAHGTGHGVGFYLTVHETPPTISFAKDDSPLAEGMVVTNEPGYYKEGAFGIRLENMMLVEKYKGDSSLTNDMLCFTPLTLAPFDKNLIDFSRLTQKEKAWLKDYHHKVYATLSPHLSQKESAWLKQKTELD